MKKLTLIILCILITLTSVVGFAAENKYEYISSVDYSNTQGTNNWYYMYSTAKTISTCKNMTWGEWSNIFLTCYAYSDANNNKASVYISSGGLQKPNLSSNVVKMWEAPMNGNIHITSNGNVRKNESQSIGCTVAAKIYKSDPAVENVTLLWKKEIVGTDTVGVNYNLDVNINQGDKIFFELSCVGTDAYGECQWDPKISYNQAVAFSKFGKQIKSFSELTNGDTIDCVFYDKDTVSEDMLAYFTLYNKDGGMVAMSKNDITLEDWTTREVQLSIPINFGETSYEGWSATFLPVTKESGRCYFLLEAEPYCLK